MPVTLQAEHFGIGGWSLLKNGRCRMRQGRAESPLTDAVISSCVTPCPMSGQCPAPQPLHPFAVRNW